MVQALVTSSGGKRSATLPSTRQRPALSRRQKAAIIVRVLLKEGSDISLADLPESMQVDLTHEMGAMRLIDRTTLKSVVREFVDDLNGLGMAFPGGLAGAIDVLEDAISPTCARQLRKTAGVPVKGDPWKIIAKLEDPAMLDLVQRESAETSAVILSKLPVARSAALLGLLPGDLARRITYAVSMTSGIDPETVETIGMAVAAQITSEPPKAFDDAPVDRVGAILNFSRAATRDGVLTGLDETDKEFAGEVRKAIFTFTNIPERIIPRDIPKIARAVDQGLLVTALAGGANSETEAEAAEFVLANMSQRLAGQIREEIEERGKVPAADAEEAMSAVVNAIRDMEQAGELELIVPDDTD